MTACDAAASAGCQGFTYVGGTNGVGSGNLCSTLDGWDDADYSPRHLLAEEEYG